jgi:hypothetical protein
VLHELAPPPTGKSGRPRTKGARIGTPTDLAASATWSTTQVRRYGRTDTVHITEVLCLWYGSFHTRTVRVILVRDDKPRTRDRDDRGYGLPLVTTDLESTPEDLVARYASRWGIEQAFADARQVIGVGQARNRLRRAVERTVPFGLTCLSLITVWYALHGHAPDDALVHRTRARWYTTKTDRPTTTWSSSSAASSSRRDFAAHAPTWPPRKKPEPSSQPGPQPEHDQLEVRNHEGVRNAPNRSSCPKFVIGCPALPLASDRPS